MLESVKNFTHSSLLAIQKPFSFIHHCGEWVDGTVANLTNDCLSGCVATTAQTALHLFPYITAALLLPPIPALCVIFGFAAFKAIATLGTDKGTYFDIGGPLVGGGALMGVLAAKKISLLWPTLSTVTGIGYTLPGLLIGSALAISAGLIQTIYEKSDKHCSASSS
jgi:hypothetical protein